MSTLYMKLPSFATDYSGFLSLLHGLGGLMVVHDPSGCLGNYTNCDEPRWYHEPQPVFSSGLRELDAIVGDDLAAVEKISAEIRRRKPPFVCILGTPVPALTGCDVAAIAEALRQDCGVPCFGIPTDGFQFYDDGIRRGLKLLRDHFMTAGLPRETHSVNVLGMTALDYSIYGEKEKFSALIERMGYHISAFLGFGDDLTAVRQARKAEKNIVMCAAALPLAQKMAEEDAIPYWVGPPLGKTGVASLQAFLAGRPMPELSPSGPARSERVLIVGEQACSNAMRRYLQAEHGFADITVATFFSCLPALSRPGDRKADSEAALAELLRSGGFDMVVGDPLLAQIYPVPRFIPCPHPAVSSKLHWKETPSWIGDPTSHKQ